MGLYAAYGSNMDPAQMLRRCPSSPHTGTGWIRGWRLTFGAEEYGWEGALATLVPDDRALHPASSSRSTTSPRPTSGRSTPGRAPTGPLPAGAPARAHPRPATTVAYVYVLDAFEGGLPSARHLGGIADAAEAAGAPTDYVTALRSRECRSTF